MRILVPAVVLAAAAIATALGCTGQNGSSVSFATGYAPIEFTFPSGWYQNPKENPYDLQCFSRFARMNTGVFAYKQEDLATDSTPTAIFWEQVNDLKSKRKNMAELEPVQKRAEGDKSITTVVYTGEKDASRNCYRISLIEFAGDASKFAVVLQVALPGEWNQSKPVLEEITQSARLLPEGK